MKPSPQDQLHKLRQLMLIAAAAKLDFEAQLDLCFEVGCRTFDIANATGLQASAVSNRRRRWREQKLMAGAVE